MGTTDLFPQSRTAYDRYSRGLSRATRDRLWIFDWEESRSDAPVLTDEVTFFMSLYHARVLADPIEGLRLLAKRFLDGADDARRRDVMMALAFRDAIGIEAATLLIRNWSELP